MSIVLADVYVYANPWVVDSESDFWGFSDKVPNKNAFYIGFRGQDQSKKLDIVIGINFCLEFSQIDNEMLNKIYKIYSKSIPHIGKYITGKSEPYEYLIKSIDKFYNQNELSEIFKANGFDKIEYRNLSGGIVAIHSGWKI